MRTKNVLYISLPLFFLFQHYSIEAQIKVESNGRVEITKSGDATKSANSGPLEIQNALRIDGNEIILNQDKTLYLNNDNNGNVVMDGGTFTLDASDGRIGVGINSPTAKLDVNGSIKMSSLIDRNNTTFKLDPSGTSKVNRMDATTSYIAVMYDLNNSSYYCNPSATSIMKTVRADKFEDRNNTAYYLNPNSTSNVLRLDASSTYVGSMYDKDNSSYYCNPTFQSKLNKVIPLNDNAGYCGTYSNTWGYGYIRYIYRTAEYYHSDRRIKENIQPISDALATVLKLDGRKYDLKKSFVDQKGNNIPTPEMELEKKHAEEHGEKDDAHHEVSSKRAEDERTGHYGFIAQDVQEVLPEIVVHDEESDMYSMSYSAIIPILVEAIKDQQKQIDELKVLLNQKIEAYDEDK